MDSKHENVLSMLRSVLEVIDRDSTAFQAVPALWATCGEFRNKVAEIEQTVSDQVRHLNGITLDKQNSREKLIELSVQLSGIIKAYAGFSNNMNLFKQVHYTASSLLKMRDETMYDTCVIIRDAANQNQASLTDFGLTSQTIPDYDAVLTDYHNRIEEPKNARARRKYYTKQIALLTRQATSILKLRLDTNIMAIATAHPETAKVYTNSRSIYNYGSHRKRTPIDDSENNAFITGTILDADESPVEGALVTVENTEINCLTDEEGEYYLENIPAGSYTLIISKDGYDTITDNTIVVAAADEITKDYTLQVSANPA